MNKINVIIFTLFFYLVYTLVRCATFLFLVIQLKKWHKKKKGTVLFFENFPIENAGYQYRSRKWVDILNENNFKAKVVTTIPSKADFEELLHQKTLLFFTISLLKRTCQVFMSVRYQTVTVRRELLHYNDYGNLFLEKLLLTLHKNVILDFDDDISASKHEPRKLNTLYSKLMLENGSKFMDSLKIYTKFIVGSAYLKDYVLKINPKIEAQNICVIPTCVDYEKHKKKKYPTTLPSPLVLGWIGGVGNLKLLENIIPSLNKVNHYFPIKLLVISGKKINTPVNFEIENVTWSYDTQIKEMLRIDVGLMPLTNTKIAKGKCGFKLIQYMGLGIVSVASAITVNKEIITENKNGFLVSCHDNEWETTLKKVINNYFNFPEIGIEARETIIEKYSFVANTTKYIKFITN